MKVFDLKTCKKEIIDTGNWHLGNHVYQMLKKEWIKNVIKIIEKNIKHREEV